MGKTLCAFVLATCWGYVCQAQKLTEASHQLASLLLSPGGLPRREWPLYSGRTVHAEMSHVEPPKVHVIQSSPDHVAGASQRIDRLRRRDAMLLGAMPLLASPVLPANAYTYDDNGELIFREGELMPSGKGPKKFTVRNGNLSVELPARWLKKGDEYIDRIGGERICTSFDLKIIPNTKYRKTEDIAEERLEGTPAMLKEFEVENIDIIRVLGLKLGSETDLIGCKKRVVFDDDDTKQDESEDKGFFGGLFGGAPKKVPKSVYYEYILGVKPAVCPTSSYMTGCLPVQIVQLSVSAREGTMYVVRIDTDIDEWKRNSIELKQVISDVAIDKDPSTDLNEEGVRDEYEQILQSYPPNEEDPSAIQNPASMRPEEYYDAGGVALSR